MGARLPIRLWQRVNLRCVTHSALQHPSQDHGQRDSAHGMAILDALIGAPGDADTLGGLPDADLSVATPCAQQLSYHHAASLLRGASCLARESTPTRCASRLAPLLLHGR